uniref:Circumsporozoite protein n=1 Tax=Steinernema glaseri TaxID=37863 RepID=A0A1I8AED4_9BILA
DRRHKALEADQKARVVIQRGQRADQYPGDRADQRGQAECGLAGQLGGDAHQLCAGTVERSGTQRLAVQAVAEEGIQQADQQQRAADHQQALQAHRQLAEHEHRLGQGFGAHALGAEHQQAHAHQRDMHRHRHDQQQQHRGLGHPLVHQAVQQRPQRRDQGQGQQNLQQRRQARQVEVAQHRPQQQR